MSSINSASRTSAGKQLLGGIRRQPWLVATVASVVMYLVLVPLSASNAFTLLFNNLYLASFIAITALGQLFVVTTGRGAIDLSIPNIVTLCVYVATIIQDNTNSNFVLSVVVTLGVGAGIGAVNGLAVTGLRIPAMVATLAVGFVTQSVVQVLSSSSGHTGASPFISALARERFFGIPYIVIIAVLITVIVGVVVHRTGFGARLVATGQNDVAALLTGLKPTSTRFMAFVVSGLLAATAAILLGGYSGGASLGVGGSYLIASIAAVVLGGTLMSGGLASIGGTFAGAALLTLIITLTNTLNLAAGMRSIIEGGAIMVALVIGARRRARE